MKLLAILALTLSFSAVANTANPTDCLKIDDELDRKYCLDKHLAGVKKAYDAEKKTWGKGLSGDAKQDKEEMYESEIEAKKEYLNMIQSEIGLTEKQLADLKAVSVTAPAKKAPKKKKKKDKGGFKIKL